MAMGTLADLEDQDPIPDKENPLKIHLKVSLQNAPCQVTHQPGWSDVNKSFSKMFNTKHNLET